MADTPLHLHPAVVHLMGTEHWPTFPNLFGRADARLVWGDDPFSDDGDKCWRWETPGGASTGLPEEHAHDLITLAAVRGMWAQKNMVFAHKSKQGGYLCSVVPMEADAFGTNDPTELLAILEAYRATVMEPAP